MNIVNCTNNVVVLFTENGIKSIPPFIRGLHVRTMERKIGVFGGIEIVESTVENAVFPEHVVEGGGIVIVDEAVAARVLPFAPEGVFVAVPDTSTASVVRDTNGNVVGYRRLKVLR